MTYKYIVTGLDCPNCAKKLCALVEKIEGVESARLNFLSEEMTVESTLDAATLGKAVVQAGRDFSTKVTVVAK
ncbi:MAG: cation transporter [Clostridia bacterium]|nr:cation transporter [Clostridia bacterium]